MRWILASLWWRLPAVRRRPSQVCVSTCHDDTFVTPPPNCNTQIQSTCYTTAALTWNGTRDCHRPHYPIAHERKPGTHTLVRRTPQPTRSSSIVRWVDERRGPVLLKVEVTKPSEGISTHSNGNWNPKRACGSPKHTTTTSTNVNLHASPHHEPVVYRLSKKNVRIMAPPSIKPKSRCAVRGMRHIPTDAAAIALRMVVG